MSDNGGGRESYGRVDFGLALARVAGPAPIQALPDTSPDAWLRRLLVVDDSDIQTWRWPSAFLNWKAPQVSLAGNGQERLKCWGLRGPQGHRLV